MEERKMTTLRKYRNTCIYFRRNALIYKLKRIPNSLRIVSFSRIACHKSKFVTCPFASLEIED